MQTDWVNEVNKENHNKNIVNNISTYIVKNWSTLPKSSFNDFNVVIFKEIQNEDHGYGHHVYEGYGVDEKGDVYWCYSSGCSCHGSCEASIVKDLKVFLVDGGINLDIDPSTVDFNSLAVKYDDY